jgi:hypothetical protein
LVLQLLYQYVGYVMQELILGASNRLGCSWVFSFDEGWGQLTGWDGHGGVDRRRLDGFEIEPEAPRDDEKSEHGDGNAYAARGARVV